MATWLALALLVVTILSLAATTIVTSGHTTTLAEGVLRGRASALLALQAGQVERQVQAWERETAALAASRTVVEAVTRFEAAYLALEELPPNVAATARTEVDAFYRDELVPQLELVTGEPIPASRLLPTDAAAAYLQQQYTIPDTGSAVPPREVGDAGDGSTWSSVHAELHPLFQELVDRLQLADLLLVAPSGRVVYSVAKLPDFATSLEVGPYSGSVLADAVDRARAQPEVVVSDLAPYGPAGGRPAGFIAAGILDGQRLVGVLATAVDVDVIDQIMTAGGQWEQAGFGATGETFLVAADGRMRSVARGFVEDRDGFLQAVAETGTATARERAAMAATGTTATFQQALRADDLDAADEGDLTRTTSATGDDVLTAVTAVDVDDLGWRVATQVEASQVAAPVERFHEQTLLAVAVLVVALTFLIVPWARWVFAPVRAVGRRLERIRRGADLEAPVAAPGPVRRGPAEFVELADSVEEMLAALRRQQADVDEAVEARRRALRTLLPPGVADRIDAGERRVVDEILQASIVVLVLHGLGDVVSRQSATQSRELLGRVVHRLDLLADEHGLARVKLLGDAYFAGCGLDRPYLDHASRSVAFTRDAFEVVRDVAVGDELELTAGIDSGPVTVGLAGSALLVYDAWGDAIGAAESLALRSRPGEARVSDRTRALLPSDTVLTGDGTSGWLLQVATSPAGATEGNGR